MARYGSTASPARTRRRLVVGGGVAIALLLSGCAGDSLADQYRAGSGKNFIAGDGSITEITAAKRLAPVEFSGSLTSGDTTTSADYRGRVLVLNFWYAGCAPCRAEAPDLQMLWTRYRDQGVSFVGVNIRDQVNTALGFEETYGITYPSVIDASTGDLQLAFSGTVAPNAVPTTIVLDKKGRVSARILGRIPDAGVLNALIKTALAESNT
ncbi:MAG: TlpA disulfide reductase family protein [Cryobacterium sp.]